MNHQKMNAGPKLTNANRIQLTNATGAESFYEEFHIFTIYTFFFELNTLIFNSNILTEKILGDNSCSSKNTGTAKRR